MLVLTRAIGESVQITVPGLQHAIKVQIVRVSRNKVRIGFEHPDRDAVTVLRSEKTEASAVPEWLGFRHPDGDVVTVAERIG